MYTYKIEEATFEDFMNLVGRATESGKPDRQMFDGAVLSRLIYKGEVIALAAYKDMYLEDGQEWRVVAGMFRNDIKAHPKAIVCGGRQYLKMISGKPMLALAADDNPVFRRFLEFMGFDDTKELESLPETDTMYRIYVRK